MNSRRAGWKLFLLVCLIWLPQGLLPVEARVVRDQVGRDVAVPDHPRRVIALAPSITEIVFSLGREDCLKGVTQHSNFPAAALSLPRVGSYVHPDLERIVALRPDLCIAIKDGNPQGLAAQLDALRIPVYAINPMNLRGVTTTILEIGDLLGARPRAEQLVKEMQSRIERVKLCVAQTPKRPRVFFQIGVAPMVSVGTGTYANELIDAAGGDNVTKGDVPYPRVTREEVLMLQPDVIIITSMTRGQDFDNVRDEWKRWPNLPAVRNGRIFILNSNLFDRPTFRLVEGLELLARCIHPEVFQGQP